MMMKLIHYNKNTHTTDLGISKYNELLVVTINFYFNQKHHNNKKKFSWI